MCLFNKILGNASENVPSVSKKFNKSIDVYEVQKFLANKICNFF